MASTSFRLNWFIVFGIYFQGDKVRLLSVRSCAADEASQLDLIRPDPNVARGADQIPLCVLSSHAVEKNSPSRACPGHGVVKQMACVFLSWVEVSPAR